MLMQLPMLLPLRYSQPHEHMHYHTRSLRTPPACTEQYHVLSVVLVQVLWSLQPASHRQPRFPISLKTAKTSGRDLPLIWRLAATPSSPTDAQARRVLSRNGLRIRGAWRMQALAPARALARFARVCTMGGVATPTVDGSSFPTGVTRTTTAATRASQLPPSTSTSTQVRGARSHRVALPCCSEAPPWCRVQVLWGNVARRRWGQASVRRGCSGSQPRIHLLQQHDQRVPEHHRVWHAHRGRRLESPQGPSSLAQ